MFKVELFFYVLLFNEELIVENIYFIVVWEVKKRECWDDECNLVVVKLLGLFYVGS